MSDTFRTTKKVVLSVGLLLIIATLPCVASTGTTPVAVSRVLHTYHSFIPLGSEIFSYSTRREHQIFYVMVAAQDGEFEGEQVWLDGEKRVLRTATGTAVEQYPRQVRFRVSVSERSDLLLTDSPLPLETHTGTFNELITGLKFEMRICHALVSRTLRPTKVKHIGVPPDVPSSERVYEVTFDLGDVPISDRVVMHVLTDEGERMAKFNLDLY